MKFPTTPKSGNVSFFIQGATIPGLTGNFTQTPPSTTSQRRSRLTYRNKRGIFDFASGILSSIASATSFSKNLSSTIPPIDVNKDFPLLDASVDCSGSVGGASAGLSASIKSDLRAKANAVVTVGASANGTIIPPSISEFVMFAGMFPHCDTFDGFLVDKSDSCRC
jgi:hypothetical protein